MSCDKKTVEEISRIDIFKRFLRNNVLELGGLCIGGVYLFVLAEASAYFWPEDSFGFRLFNGTFVTILVALFIIWNWSWAKSQLAKEASE